MGALLDVLWGILYYSNNNYIVPNSKHQINVIDYFKYFVPKYELLMHSKFYVHVKIDQLTVLIFEM